MDAMQTPARQAVECAVAAAPSDNDRASRDLSSLEHFLVPLRRLLDDRSVTELCINRPHEAFVERHDGWSREHLPFASFEWCHAFARLVANHTRQRISASEPLLSATLPSLERVQIVLPPATDTGTVSITVRRPSSELWTLDDLRRQGVFEQVQVLPADNTHARDEPQEAPDPLRTHLTNRDVAEFLRQAVKARKNILLSGATGSGKTTISKALILEIPSEDRIVTIEDVKELSLANQPNHVRLYYSQGGQGESAVTARELLASAKRQRPDRVFVSELRTGDEVYDYLVSINTGHPGSITSVHADSAQMAFLALAQMLKRSDAGRGMSTREGIELAQLSVDVVVQCARVHQRRFVSEVWYDPSARLHPIA
jgi:type IV secretion system protein VirB11